MQLVVMVILDSVILHRLVFILTVRLVVLNIYNNSVNMNSATLTHSGITLTAALLLNTSTITAIDLQNNIFVNTMNNTGSTTAKNYAIYSSAANTAFTNINNNDYYVSGTQGVLGYLGSDQATLAALVTSFGQNANSISADPVFVSVPVQLTPTVSALNGTGAALASVTVDYSGITRTTPPDMGAVEFTPPTCYAPTALTATSVTAAGATLGWTAGGTETVWNIEYGVTGFTQGTGTTVTGVTNPYILSGLTQNTTYQYYVKADCGGSGLSTWTGPFSFTTPYSCPKPTVPTVANITATSAQLAWTNGGTETSWIVYYKTAAATDYTEVLNVTTNPYTLNGLSQNTNYIFKVKANCSASDTSVVSDTKAFDTPQNPAVLPYAEGFETWPNNWSVVNGTETNKWAVGTAVANTGTQSAYVSNDNGTTNAYTLTSTSIVHMYRDITFPAGTNPFVLKFNWKGSGEGTSTLYDYLRVSIVPTTTVPVAGTALTTGLIGKYNLQSGWQTVNASLANATYANQTWRLVFTWNNDESAGTQPPIAIDDISITELLCASPTALTATSITATGATLGWTAGGTETAWNVEYGVTGFTQGTGTTVTGVTNPYILSGLTQNTTYQYYVKADCGGSGLSTWAGPFSFTTPCNAISTLPWTEGFETGYTDAAAIAGCWSQVSTTGTAVWNANSTATTYNRTPRTGTFNATLYYSNEDWLFYPFSLTAGTSYTFEMYARQDGSATTDANITVAYGVNAAAASMTSTIIASTGLTSGNYQLLSGAFTPTTTGTYYIGIKGYINSTPWYISIDDIKLDLTPACVAPTALTATSITATGATLGWTAGGTETAWNIEYGVTGFAQGSGTTVTGVTNPYPLSSLTQHTTYQFYVKADCGGSSGLSTWAGPFSFSTPYSCPKPTLPTVANITTISADLGWTAGGTETSWIVYYKTAAATDYTEVLNVTANPYTLNGLSQGTNYIFKVKANCSASDTSVVSATKTFSTPYSCPKPTLPTVTNITTISADLGWTAGGTETSWIVYYKTAAATDYTAITGVTTNPYTLNGLTSATNYIFKVKADCSASDTSVVSATKTFTTACDIVNVFPYVENFEATTLPTCWSETRTPSSSYGWESYATGYENRGLRFESYYNASGNVSILKSPALNITSLTTAQAEFWWKNPTGGNFKVVLSTDGGATFPNTLVNNLTGQTNWTLQTIDLTSYIAAGSNVVIGFEGTSNWGSGDAYVYLDKLTIGAIPTCLTPTVLTATGITTTTADLTWTSTAPNFKIRYRTIGATNWTFVTSSTPSVSLNGLNSASNYEVQVMAICSATDSSAWTGSANFQTLCSAFNVPIVQNFDAVTTPVLPICWNKIVTSTSTYASVETTTGSTQTAPNNVVLYNSNDVAATLILASPEVAPALNTLRVKFNVYGSNADDVLSVGTMTDPLNAATYTELQSLTITGTETNYTVDLSAYAGADKYIAFKHGLGGTYISIYLDDVKIETIPSCFEPTAVIASNATVNSADIAWTSTAPNFKIRYRTVGATDWTITTATASPKTLNGLTHSSNYEAQVMAVCTATDSSEWSNLVNFATLCDVFTVPFLQDFNVLPFAPNCWSMSKDTLNSTIDLSGTTSSWISDNYLNVDNGQLAARLNIYGTSADSWLITPQINLGTGANQLEFDLAATEYGEETVPVGTRLDDKFAVVISTDGGTTWSQTNVLRQWDNSGSTYVYNNINATPQHITIDLSAYSGVVKLAFYGESFVTGNGDNDLFVDNVAVNPILAPCDVPTALAASNVAQTTADLGWTSTAANFNVRYRTVGATTWMTSTATTTTLALTLLTANTQYEFQVQAVCSATAGDTSNWATAVNFTTTENVPTCDAPTALVVSAISEAGATLNWTAGGTETAWNIHYKKVADATYTNVSNTTTKPYILTGLQSSTAYVWNVQAVCSSTLTSVWSADNTFNTTVGIESNSLSGLSVYSFDNKVNVINNGNILVKEVVIYDVIGREVGKYAINSTDNILINTNLVIGNYMVKVITASQVSTYKLFIK